MILLDGLVLCSCVVALSGAAEPDFSRVPGSVVAHSPARTRIYLGSPGLLVLPDGTYLAKHDEFGPGSNEKDNAITRVYRSTDRGATWQQIVRVEKLFWASLFYHRGAVYMMGSSAGHRHGYAVIMKSEDGGETWTTPDDENSGRLFADRSYHTAPVPVVLHDGRLWRAMEDEQGDERKRWSRTFRAFMMSAPEEADLLKASSWTSSDRLGHKAEYLGGRFGGWLEGNAVVTPGGEILNILRVDYRILPERAAIIRYSADGNTSYFDPERDFIAFPGGCKKFVIRRDPRDPTRYWALSNPTLPQHAGYSVERARNTLALLTSTDLREWTIKTVLLYHPSIGNHAFQYPDALIDGDDLLVLSRTAYDDGIGGAHREHDANFITFHRFGNFRDLTPADSAVEWARDDR